MPAKHWVTLLLIISFFIAAPRPCSAQATLRLERLQVDLWPEYDRSAMLVIYRGRLPADTLLPATLTLRLPARVGQPHAVAYEDGSGGLLQVKYSTTTSGDWLAVTLETPAPNFHLEFYDRLNRADDRRDYTFVWPGDYAVNQLAFLLLPPAKASAIQTEPALFPVQGEDGDTTYHGLLDNLAAGQETRLTVSYRVSADGNSRLPVVGAVAVLLLLVIGGIVWYTRRPAPEPETTPPSRRRPRQPRTQRRRSAGAGRLSEEVVAPGERSPAGYCTHCGRPLRADDRFCGHCGTAVKNKDKNV